VQRHPDPGLKTPLQAGTDPGAEAVPGSEEIKIETELAHGR